MASTGVLIRPSLQDEEAEKVNDLWNQTWKRLERFLPELKGELFPPEPLRAPEPIEPVEPVEHNVEEAVLVENEEEKDKQSAIAEQEGKADIV